MKWILLVFLLISCSDNMRLFQSSLQEKIIPEFVLPANGVRVLLLTGQSNALGVAPSSSATAPELLPSTQVKIWRNDTKIFEYVDVGTGINNVGATPGSTHGMELGIGNYWTDETGFTDELHIIKWGVSSECIVEFLSGGSVYNGFSTRVQEGINSLLTAGKRPFVYFAYDQGECDSNTQPTADAYSSNFDSLISLWETDLGSNLPFNAVEIIEVDARDLQINTVFNDKALIDENIKVIETSGYGDIGDNLHYNYSAQKLIANQVMTAMRFQTPIEITSPL